METLLLLYALFLALVLTIPYAFETSGIEAADLKYLESIIYDNVTITTSMLNEYYSSGSIASASEFVDGQFYSRPPLFSYTLEQSFSLPDEYGDWGNSFSSKSNEHGYLPSLRLFLAFTNSSSPMILMTLLIFLMYIIIFPINSLKETETFKTFVAFSVIPISLLVVPASIFVMIKFVQVINYSMIVLFPRWNIEMLWFQIHGIYYSLFVTMCIYFFVTLGLALAYHVYRRWKEPLFVYYQKTVEKAVSILPSECISQETIHEILRENGITDTEIKLKLTSHIVALRSEAFAKGINRRKAENLDAWARNSAALKGAMVSIEQLKRLVISSDKLLVMEVLKEVGISPVGERLAVLDYLVAQLTVEATAKHDHRDAKLQNV